MRDPYSVLGVPRSADAGEIKKAFRRLAKKLHPDANKNDQKAAVKFAELNAAYEIIGDEDKRKAFDRGNIDAEGKPRYQGFEGFARNTGPGAEGTFTFRTGDFAGGRPRGGAGGFGRFEDILSSVFGGRAGARGGPRGFGGEFDTDDFITPGADVTASVTITLPEAARGAARRVRLPTGKEVEVKIPAGLTDGQQIRLKGQGIAFPGQPAGDALITVSVAAHPRFKIDGANLRVDVPIRLYEAVLGAKVRVPTLDGAVDLAIPAGTNGGRTFRLRGKGLPNKGTPGDLLADIRIVLPERRDPELEQLMLKWRDANPYDPRADTD